MSSKLQVKATSAKKKRRKLAARNSTDTSIQKYKESAKTDNRVGSKIPEFSPKSADNYKKFCANLPKGKSYRKLIKQ